MFSPDGLSRVLAALVAAGQWGVRFNSEPETIYPTDPGYPVVADSDDRNIDRGQHVVTWRVTVPRGVVWPIPATHANLVEPSTGAIMYKMGLSKPFGTSPTHPSILFLNVYFVR